MIADSDKMKRVLRIVYGIEGVSAARVWQWPGRVAVAVSGKGIAEEALLKRVEIALNALRDPGEEWEFGILQDP
jgi:hypothetical protein